MPHAPLDQIDSQQVIQEVAAGGGLALSAAARLMPKGPAGRPVAPATCWRWAQYGARAPDGRIVKLEVCRVGCRWVTTKQAVARFIAALTGSAATVPAAPTTRTGDQAANAQRLRDVQAELARKRV